MIFREIITKWGFDIEKDKLDGVEDRLAKIQGRLEFLAATEIVKGIWELGEKFAHLGESLSIAAASAGIGVEQFQQLAFAANKSGITADEMGMSMARLARHIYDARKGGEESLKAFSQAGFSSAQIQGLHTSADAMAILADRFKTIQDPIQKQALAMQLLGRGSVNMVGFLSQGSGAIRGMGLEAQRVGAIISSGNVQALTKLEHSLSTLAALIKAVSGTIAAQFAPSMENAVEEFIKFYEVNQKIIQINVKAWVWDITYAMGAIWAIVKFVSQAFFDFSLQHPLLTRRIGETVLAIGALVLSLWATSKAIGVVQGAISVLTGSFQGLQFGAQIGFKPIIWLAGLAKSGIAGIIGKLGVLIVQTFPALGEALITFGAFLEATPIGWFITAIAALVIALHDLYAIFFQGKSFKDTWIGQAFEFAKGAAGKIGSFFGIGGDSGQPGGESIIDKVKTVKDVATSDAGKFLPSLNLGANLTAGASEENSQISAPVSIYVQGAGDPAIVAAKVRDEIKAHLDRQNRETQQSLRPAKAY